MNTPHALDLLAAAIADARPEDLAEARDRAPPSFPPHIRRPEAPATGEPCAECDGQHKGRAELLYVALYGAPGRGLVRMESTMPLCAPCAALARRRGWPALARTWRRLCSVPFEAAELHATPAQGGC